jgi:hypothetical protein
MRSVVSVISPPVLSDDRPGLDTFFEPGEEILIARTADEAVDELDREPRSSRPPSGTARARSTACS